MDVASLDLWFRRGISVITLAFGIVQLYLTEKNIWIDAGFIICMAGIVGYYTNYLAIKMLFQPKQGKVLGWEGLVPKNKANIARLPASFKDELMSRMNQGGGLVVLLIELVALAAVIAFVILLVQGTRRIPVNFAKKIVGNKQYGGVRQYIPLKVNAAGVMPIIFAQAIMFIPATIAQFFPESNASQGILATFGNYTSFWYNFVFATLIILFTYFYTAISGNTEQQYSSTV